MLAALSLASGASAQSGEYADLVVASVSTPASVGALQQLTVTATVVNQGLAQAPASTLQLSFVPIAPAGYAYPLGYAAVGSLAPGGEQTVTVTFTLHWNMPQGTYVVRAAADAGAVVPESDETNNVRDSAPLAFNLPDVVATALSFPPTAAQGSTTPVTLTILNQGLGDARPFTVSLMVTRDGGVCTQLQYCDETDDDWSVGSAYVSAGLAAGAQQTVTIPMAIANGFEPLPWNLFSVVDGPVMKGFGSVRESSESNNTNFWGSLTVVPGGTTLAVGIDIKPGSYPNAINLGSNGVVPVAILSSLTFDATTVDPLTVTLASSPIVLRGNGLPSASMEDVNGDGLPDLVVHVQTEALQLTSTSTAASLQGSTYSGQAIAGNDDVIVVP
jgi:CARDB protein